MPDVKTILVVDDNKDLREMVSLVLKMQNYAVVAASNELVLLAQLKQQTPDIILLDIYLDQEDGKEIAKKLKENESTALIPIILYSAENITARSITESLADCFLPKPFELPNCSALLSRACLHNAAQPALDTGLSGLQPGFPLSLSPALCSSTKGPGEKSNIPSPIFLSPC